MLKHSIVGKKIETFFKGILFGMPGTAGKKFENVRSLAHGSPYDACPLSRVNA